MKTSKFENGPVIIGGIGGSGTRVIAEILKLFGYFMGHDLNGASDNLTYTLLFKRPDWYIKNANNTRYLTTGLRIMEKCMVTGDRLSLKEKFYLKRAVRDMSKHGHNREGQGKGDWPVQRLAYIKNPQELNDDNFRGWGWKEPNSHLMVPVFNEYFKDFRYIHTIRHGLDMAYSSNQQQLFNWASLYGVNIPEKQDDIPAASFRYWVEANRKVITFGNQLGGRKFLLVNYDKLCEDPFAGVKEIADFLQINIPDELLVKATALPVMPESAGRYKNHPGDVFNEEDLLFLEAIGFQR